MRRDILYAIREAAAGTPLAAPHVSKRYQSTFKLGVQPWELQAFHVGSVQKSFWWSCVFQCFGSRGCTFCKRC